MTAILKLLNWEINEHTIFKVSHDLFYMLHFTCLDFLKNRKFTPTFFWNVLILVRKLHYIHNIFCLFLWTLHMYSSRRHRSVLTSNDAVNLDQSVPEIIYYNTWKRHCPNLVSVVDTDIALKYFLWVKFSVFN